jgi:OMF family outer membrane factor
MVKSTRTFFSLPFLFLLTILSFTDTLRHVTKNSLSFNNAHASDAEPSSEGPASEAPPNEGPATEGAAEIATRGSGAADLTLAEAMRLAEERSFGARLARHSAEAASGKIVQAVGMSLPRVDLDAQKVWFSKDTNALTGVSPFVPKQVTGVGITVAQPIIGLGALLLNIRAASMQATVASNESTTAARDARLSGAESFLRAQKSIALGSIAQKSYELAESQLRESKIQERTGRLSRADAMRFELAFADAKQQSTQAKVTEEIARAALAEILGSPGTNYSIPMPEESFYERKQPEIPTPDRALTAAESKRTESQNAASNVRIAEYYKIASELDYLPSLNAFVRYERDLEVKDTTYPPPPSPGGKTYDQADVQDKYSYGLQLKWNIWDWGTRWGKTEEYEANVARANVAKDAAESSVRLEVRQAVLSLQGLIDGLETSKSSVRLAEEVYRLTKARFQNGQATSNDVIAAERDQTRARGGLVNVRGDIDLAWLKLQRALGEKPEIK